MAIKAGTGITFVEWGIIGNIPEEKFCMLFLIWVIGT